MLTVERIWQDLRHGLRVFVKSPVFSAIAVISIAFGTGANVALFSAVDALLLRPPPVEQPDELITVGTRVDRGLGSMLRMSHADFVDVRDRARSFDGLLAFGFRWVGFSATPDRAARVTVAALVSANYFQLLGIEPQLGRTFRSDEDHVPGRDAVVILSDEVWQQEFGRDPAVVGRLVRISGIDFTVVGVAPKSFTGVDLYTRHGVYVPLAMWHHVMNSPLLNPLDDRNLRVLTVDGRLRTGVSLSAARAELAAIGDELARQYPQTNTGQAISAQTELQMRFERRPLDTRTLGLLSVLSIAVLCVACANVAGLLASRAPERAREIALRLSIGASRTRIITGLLAESLAIALVGGAAGVGVGYAGIVLLRQIEWPSELIVYPVIQLDERTLMFAVFAAVSSVFLFGVGPAIQTARVDLASEMKASDTRRSTRLRLRGRNALVAAQVAISLAVLTIATFVFQIFQRELTSGPGFRTSQVAMARIDPMQARYSGEESRRFFEQAVEGARRLPRVLSATVASEIPMWGLELSSMAPEGYRLADGQSGVRIYSTSVDESYFETMGIAILAGRPFRATDTAESPRVAIVNEVIARRYWPGQDAVGRRFRLKDARGPWVEVIGVAKLSTYIYTGERPFEVVYLPFRQEPRGAMMLLARTAGSSRELLDPLRAMVRGMDPAVPISDAQTIERFYEVRATSVNGIAVSFIGGLGVMGLILTMVGLYGLVSYAVGRRTREIGVRIAVGASPYRVLGMILKEGMRPAWIGLAAGLALSVITSRLLPALVPIGHRYDATTVLAVVPLLLAVSLVAAGIPARRASHVDPTVALRTE
jgi:predicted permease